MPKYRSFFRITVSVSMLCGVEVEAFNEDIAKDIALTLAKHLSVKSNIFSLQCPRTKVFVQGVLEINENADVKIENFISTDKLGD